LVNFIEVYLKNKKAYKRNIYRPLVVFDELKVEMEGLVSLVPVDSHPAN